MNEQKKVKLFIGLAILIVAVLFIVIVAQLTNISKIKKEISNQKNQIQQLEQKLDYYNNKESDSDFETIS